MFVSWRSQYPCARTDWEALQVSPQAHSAALCTSMASCIATRLLLPDTREGSPAGMLAQQKAWLHLHGSQASASQALRLQILSDKLEACRTGLSAVEVV